MRRGQLSLATARRCLSSTERELVPLSRPRLALCLTSTLHLPVAALQAPPAGGEKEGCVGRREGEKRGALRVFAQGIDKKGWMEVKPA